MRPNTVEPAQDQVDPIPLTTGCMDSVTATYYYYLVHFFPPFHREISGVLSMHMLAL
ncbi:Hypothetical predicted protein, partial [Podarcis lilfordi]